MGIDHKLCDFPTCPWCGSVDYGWWDDQPERNDGDSWEVDCFDCNLPYRVTMSVSVYFDTDAIAAKNEDTHG